MVGGVMTSTQLLIAWHSRTGASEALAQAAAEGAGDAALLLGADAVTPVHLLSAGGYLFVCPENLATMSGEMKEMFDRCYYPVLGRIEGRAYATMIAAGSDGEGAQRQIDRIATGCLRIYSMKPANLARRWPRDFPAASFKATASETDRIYLNGLDVFWRGA